MNINPINATYFRGGRSGMDDMSAEQKYRVARSMCEGDFCAPEQGELPKVAPEADAAYRNARSECEGDCCAPYQGSYSAGDAAISSDEKHQFSYLA